MIKSCSTCKYLEQNTDWCKKYRVFTNKDVKECFEWAEGFDSKIHIKTKSYDFKSKK